MEDLRLASDSRNPVDINDELPPQYLSVETYRPPTSDPYDVSPLAAEVAEELERLLASPRALYQTFTTIQMWHLPFLFL